MVTIRTLILLLLLSWPAMACLNDSEVTRVEKSWSTVHSYKEVHPIRWRMATTALPVLSLALVFLALERRGKTKKKR